MAELILMRQRIKTVETIKKITHAMRLVSMSAHAKLNKEYNAINAYHTAITRILQQLTHAYPHSMSPLSVPSEQSRTILIAIGAQKGLCGSFNSNLLHTFTDYSAKKGSSLLIVPIGKKMVDFVQEHYPTLCIQTFPHLTSTHAAAIAQTITDRIFTGNLAHMPVTILSNTLKSFFVQTPRITPLIPIHTSQNHEKTLVHDYIWDINPHQLIEQITRQYVASTLHKTLLESLLAEHAARFVSMDSSTRNAEKILETTRLKYNKLRQAKITKELLELADTF